jgi:hypothetical protein
MSKYQPAEVIMPVPVFFLMGLLCFFGGLFIGFIIWHGVY